ncbi:hypothetical protein I4U23_001025 [Adineta vaga]|nr:hypothetical protein I4U23_001025 [Adineta vaga]
MSTVPYTDPQLTHFPSSFDIARRDDFFGFGNAMQAISSITPQQTNSDGTVQHPTQIVTISSGTIPPEMALESSGGTFFDLRPINDVFADMGARLNKQREHVLNSPQLLNMLQHQ